MKTEIEHTSDTDGTAIVVIPVRDTTCTVEQADYDFLLKSGVTGKWFLANGKYVTVMKDGRHEYVARLICMCSKSQMISYRDGNPLNLRRSNLQVVEKRVVPPQFQSREAA